MPIVTIKLNNKNFQLACSEGTELQLMNLAAKLDSQLIKIKNDNPTASPELILVMAALSLQDQVASLQKQSGREGRDNPAEGENFAETLSSLAKYLENLAQKLGK